MYIFLNILNGRLLYYNTRHQYIKDIIMTTGRFIISIILILNIHHSILNLNVINAKNSVSLYYCIEFFSRKFRNNFISILTFKINVQRSFFFDIILLK